MLTWRGVMFVWLVVVTVSHCAGNFARKRTRGQRIHSIAEGLNDGTRPKCILIECVGGCAFEGEGGGNPEINTFTLIRTFRGAFTWSPTPIAKSFSSSRCPVRGRSRAPSPSVLPCCRRP